MKHSSKYINKLEIDQVISDFQIDKYTEGILAIESDAKRLLSILNKPFRSQHYVILFVTKGKVNVRINMFEYELSTNNFLTVSTSAIKEFISAEKDSEMKIILFTGQYVLNAPIGQPFREAFHIHTTQSHYFSEIGKTKFDEMKHLHDILKNALQRNETYPTVALLFFSILNKVAEILKQQEKSAETKSRKSELVISFFRLLPKYIHAHRDVDFFAKKLNINPRYLSTTLKEKTGKTALALIADMVIQEAHVMLSNPQLSINEIASKLGFPDQFTFSKYFKHYSGITPSAYRGS